MNPLIEVAALSKRQKSLLLYIETRAVDHQFELERRHLNDADIETLDQWDDDKFIDWRGVASLVCFLSDAAFDLAAALRKERARAFLAKHKDKDNG